LALDCDSCFPRLRWELNELQRKDYNDRGLLVHGLLMRKYFVFALVALPVFLGNVGSTSVAVAFPTMVSHFGTSLVVSGWVLSIYMLTAIGTIPITSKLSDTLGRRSTFMLCLAAFIVGSFLCAIAPNIGWLIFFRVIQAAGGGGFTSAVTGIVSDQMPDKRQQSIGLLSSVGNIGAIVGPNIGGAMVHSLGWQSVFWLNVPLGIVVLVLTRVFIKADIKKGSYKDLDFLGGGLLVGFVSAVMISLTLMGKTYHVPLVVIVPILLLGVFFLVVFVRRSRNSPDAVVPRQLLTRRPFLAANLFNFIYGTCGQNGIMALMPLYGASVYGMSAIESGLMLTPRSFGVVAASITSSMFLLKWGYRRPIMAGTLGIAFGLIVMALEPSGMALFGMSLPPIAVVMVLAAFVGIGAGLVNPAANNACIELMPDKVASITGLRQVVRQMGGSIGIAVSTLVLQSSTDMAQGFLFVYMGSSVILLMSIPIVFFMPRGPQATR